MHNDNQGDEMKENRNKINKIYFVIIFSVLFSSCTGPRGQNDVQTSIPEGFKLIKSTHGSYQYFLPEDWEKTTSNCYEGSYGKVFEQIYPPAEINEQYCSSMVYISSGDIQAEEIEKYLYNNGYVEGCYVLRDITNTKIGKQWRSTSFSFSTSRGVENITVNMEKPNYDEDEVLTIINSVQLN